MKDFIFLTSGEAPDLGSFFKGDIGEFESGKVAAHAEKKTLIAVDDLSRDVLISWLQKKEIIFPDKANKAELKELLIGGDISPKSNEIIEGGQGNG